MTTTDLNLATWNAAYAGGRSLLEHPDEVVVSTLNRYRDALERGLDLACGAGRHTFLMAAMGLEATGVDGSQAAIRFARARAARLSASESKRISFIHSPVQAFIGEAGAYDIVIAWGLLHYLTPEDQGRLMSLIRAMLRPGGCLLCTMRSTEDGLCAAGREIEPGRYLVDYFDDAAGQSTQTLMQFWNEEAAREYFDGFTRVDLGHRAIDPISPADRPGRRIAHWLILAQS